MFQQGIRVPLRGMLLAWFSGDQVKMTMLHLDLSSNVEILCTISYCNAVFIITINTKLLYGVKP